MKYYLDTCIWIDFIENRYDGLNPLGEYAFLFLKKCRENNYQIFYSDAVIWEIESQKYTFDIISTEFKSILKKANISKNTHKKAKKIAKQRNLGFGDVLHALLAKENKIILISRDAHFEKLEDIVKYQKPEELL